jgi:hypothetical protein
MRPEEEAMDIGTGMAKMNESGGDQQVRLIHDYSTFT